jgi:DNA polymerase bacteriophage-type
MLVTLDFETYYDQKLNLKRMTTMDYVRNDRFKVWGVGIKIDTEPTEWFSEHEAESAIRDIDWDIVTLACHNTMFDGYILARYYGVTPHYYTDTAAMSRALAPSQSARLKDCAIRFFPHDETMRKGDELADAKGIYDLDPELDDAIGGYCIQDVDLTYALYNKMVWDMPVSELDLIDMTCRMFCEPKFVADREALITFRDEAIGSTEAAIEASGIPRKVLSSNKQFDELLTSMGLVPPKKKSLTTGKEIPALGKNDKAFTQMQKMYPEHAALWAGRKASKSRINETRAQRFIDAIHPDGTMPIPLRYYGAHTGRWTGIEKINMQNLPRKSPLRTALLAPEGKLVFVADLSNIEARVLAWLADEESLLDQFRNGDDIYSNLATEIYKRPINRVDDPTERFVGKTAVLGLGYGMGAAKFQATLEAGAMGPPMKFTTKEAQNVVNTYRSAYPGIPTLWQRLEIKLASTLNPTYNEYWHGLSFDDNKIQLPNGLSLHYNNLRFEGGTLTYDARNPETTWGGRLAENVVQALSRIIVGDAMLSIQKDPGLDVDVVHTIHDEVVIIGNAINPDATMAKLIEHMCLPPVWAPDLPLDAEGGYDRCYSK